MMLGHSCLLPCIIILSEGFRLQGQVALAEWSAGCKAQSVKLTMLYEGLERLHSNLVRGGAGPVKSAFSDNCLAGGFGGEGAHCYCSEYWGAVGLVVLSLWQWWWSFAQAMIAGR